MKRKVPRKLRIKQGRVKELFNYDSESGAITRKVPMLTKNKNPDYPVGNITKEGFIRIVVDGIAISAHDLIWLYLYGAFSTDPIYYKDQNRLNLRLDNLTTDPEFRPKYAKSKMTTLINEKGLTQEVVRELFDYDPITGIATRKVSRSGKDGSAGTIINGVNDKGYIYLKFGQHTYPLHRLVFLHYHGYLPENIIDHRDRNKLNNAISNLREESHQCNAKNRTVRVTSKSGVTGVSWCTRGSTWLVKISPKLKCNKHIIYCKDFTEAVCHRYAAENCLDWNDCDANSSAYQYLKQQGILK